MIIEKWEECFKQRRIGNGSVVSAMTGKWGKEEKTEDYIVWPQKHPLPIKAPLDCVFFNYFPLFLKVNYKKINWISTKHGNSPQSLGVIFEKHKLLEFSKAQEET